MIDVGRVCIKTAGREAGKKCVVVEVTDRNFVVVDGNVRRKKCNISHLEPVDQKIDLEKDGSHDSVIRAFEQLGILSKSKKVTRKPKPAASKPSKEKTPAAKQEEKGNDRPL